jgi:AcrR family transcriptional regulator
MTAAASQGPRFGGEETESSGRGYPTLPAGRHGLGREFVEGHQRARLVAAVAAVAHELGITELTVVRITERARMSRKTFYEFFEGRKDCLRFACEEARGHLFDPVREVAERRSRGSSD